MDQIGVGLIGCGVMGTSLATNCQALEHAHVLAVSDVDEELAKKTSQDLDAVCYTDYHQLLARDDIGAVLIAVPGFLHQEIAIAAASAGKHIFCEKPMAVTLEGCDAIIEACQTHQRKLMVGHVCRFHGVHSRVKALVDEGRIGQPTCGIIRRLGGGWSGVWAKSWRTQRHMSGGTLMEVNAHELDFLRWICGDVKRVTASGGQFIDKQSDFEDIMLVTLEFASGAMGFMHSSRASSLGEYGGRVDGTEGSVHFPQIWGEQAGIHHARFDNESKEFISASDIIVEDPVKAELRAFVHAIQQDTTPPVTGLDGKAVVEIALAAYASVKTGKPVDIPMK